jgi:lysozyme family protein
MNEKVWQSAVDFVLAHEGGYANHTLDRGGETKFGISKHSYPNLDIPNLIPTW